MKTKSRPDTDRRHMWCLSSIEGGVAHGGPISGTNVGHAIGGLSQQVPIKNRARRPKSVIIYEAISEC